MSSVVLQLGYRLLNILPHVKEVGLKSILYCNGGVSLDTESIEWRYGKLTKSNSRSSVVGNFKYTVDWPPSRYAIFSGPIVVT